MHCKVLQITTLVALSLTNKLVKGKMVLVAKERKKNNHFLLKVWSFGDFKCRKGARQVKAIVLVPSSVAMVMTSQYFLGIAIPADALGQGLQNDHLLSYLYVLRLCMCSSGPSRTLLVYWRLECNTVCEQGHTK